MASWLHRLLNPHCEFCRLDSECINCDMLRQLLADERENNKRLLSAVLQDEKQVTQETNEEVKPIQINRNAIPWRVRREALETESRKEAALKRQAELENKPISIKSVEELEKELGVVHADEIGETEKILSEDSEREEIGNRTIS